MPFIPYPSVPVGTPGLPIVPVAPPGSGSIQTNNVSRSFGNGITATSSTKKWQIVDSAGTVVISPDSVYSFQYRNQQRVLDYPIENGAFASYNKISNPFEIRAILTCGGNGAMTRQEFTNRIDSMLNAVETYSFVTPDAVYPSITLVLVNYERRSNRGVSLIAADMVFTEVKTTAQAQVITTLPSSAIPKSNGQLSPVTANKSQISQIGGIN